MSAHPIRGIAGNLTRAVLVLALVAAAAGVGLRLVRGDGYQLQLVFPSAPDVVEGLQVQVDGFDAGQVTELAARDGQAIVTVTLQEPYDEINQGATAAIEWKAVLGERVIQIVPGAEDAPVLPDNAMVRGDHSVTAEWITDEELAGNPGLVKTMKVKPPMGQGRVRLIRIGNIDLQPCGGTHVARTGEIGQLKLGKIEKKGAINRRVSLLFA